MIISKIETIRVGQFPDLIFVQLHTDTGLIGLGETWYAASTVESAIHDHFGPLLIGRDPNDTRAIAEDLGEKHIKILGPAGVNTQVLAAINIACWDIK